VIVLHIRPSGIVRGFDPSMREAKEYSTRLLVARRRACRSDSCDTQVVGLVCDAN
jgi:hypothetical protein